MTFNTLRIECIMSGVFREHYVDDVVADVTLPLQLYTGYTFITNY